MGYLVEIRIPKYFSVSFYILLLEPCALHFVFFVTFRFATFRFYFISHFTGNPFVLNPAMQVNTTMSAQVLWVSQDTRHQVAKRNVTKKTKWNRTKCNRKKWKFNMAWRLRGFIISWLSKFRRLKGFPVLCYNDYPNLLYLSIYNKSLARYFTRTLHSPKL
jgi:hypothetical protein